MRGNKLKGWTLEQAATAVGVTAKAVEVRRKRYPFSHLEDGSLDPAKFEREWQMLRQRAAKPGEERLGRPALGAVEKLSRLADLQSAAKAKLDIERARMARIRRKKAEGSTCDTAEVESYFGMLMVEASESLMTWPAAVAADGAGVVGCEAAALEAWLEGALRAHVTGMVARALEQAARFRAERAAGVPAGDDGDMTAETTGAD